MYTPTPIDEYIVIPHPDGSWNVWNELKDTLYRVNKREKGKFICNCLHFYHRLRKSGGQCNHIKAVKRRGDIQ